MHILETQLQSYAADSLSITALYTHLRYHFRESFLLETSMGMGIEGRYTIIACDMLASWEVQNGRIYERRPDGSERTTAIEQPNAFLDSLRTFSQSFDYQSEKPLPQLPFQGIWGYMGYDAARYRYPQLFTQRQQDAIPVAWYGVYAYTFIFDHQTQIVHIAENRPKGAAFGWSALEPFLKKTGLVGFPFRLAEKPRAQVDDKAMEQQLQSARTRCREGEAFSAALAQPFTAKGYGDIFWLYRAWMRHQRPRHCFFIEEGDFQLVGMSGDNHFFADGNAVQIAWELGQVARTDDDERDIQTLLQSIQSPEKQRSLALWEDACFNELSIEQSDVQWISKRRAQLLGHQARLVTRCRTDLGNRHPVDWLWSLFPALPGVGISRHGAMSIANSLEPQARGFHSGSMGFMGNKGIIQQIPLSHTLLYNDQQLSYFVQHPAYPNPFLRLQTQAQQDWAQALDWANDFK